MVLCPIALAAAMPIIRWPVTMRVPMWVAYSSRRICFLTEAVHGPCYASPTASVGPAAARFYAMSFRLLTDAPAPYLPFIARMVAGGLARHRVQSLKAVRDRTG